jgi:hypothetical protein
MQAISNETIYVDENYKFLSNIEKKQEDFEKWLQDYQLKKSMSHLSFYELITEWKETKNMMANLKAKEELLRAAVIMRSPEQNCEAYGIKVEKVKRKGSINWKSIPEIQNLDLEQFREDEIEYYKITEIKNEE